MSSKNGEHTGYINKYLQISSSIRKYLFEKYNSKCCKCGWCKINPITKRVPLQVNHIDGDATNCNEHNLELICPNCHSLTPNFGSLNKNGKRKYRYENIDMKINKASSGICILFSDLPNPYVTINT